jgi:hypothetical protein
VIEGCGCVSLAMKARFGGGIEVEVRKQKFQGDGSSQLSVIGAIHDAHSAGSEHLANVEVRNSPTGDAEQVRLMVSIGDEVRGAHAQIAADFRVGLQQQLERPVELRVAVGKFCHSPLARTRVEVDDRVEACADFLPARRVHGSDSPLRSTASHARAERRSRLAVASATPSAAALSSRERPPKYRYCRSLPWRGLSCARRLSASSRSVKLSRFSSENSASSSSGNGLTPDPRFSVRRARA